MWSATPVSIASRSILCRALNTIERVTMVTMLVIPPGCLIASDGSPSRSQRRWVGDEPAHVLAVQHGRVVPAAGCVDLQEGPLVRLLPCGFRQRLRQRSQSRYAALSEIERQVSRVPELIAKVPTLLRPTHVTETRRVIHPMKEATLTGNPAVRFRTIRRRVAGEEPGNLG
jgi:hypothetical protein